MTDSEYQPKHPLEYDVLSAAVRIATGLPHAKPRPGQSVMLDDIADALHGDGEHRVGEAPTGSGKSLAALSAAAVMAVTEGKRTIVSTESLALQSQYVDKDGKTIAAAAREVLGQPVDVQVLKGWQNMVCAQKAIAAAGQIAGPQSKPGNPFEILARQVESTPAGSGRSALDSENSRDVVAWALRQHNNDNLLGDRASFDGVASDAEWASVSVAPAECVGENQCPMADYCKPLRSRERAAGADIVVTNHSMLAVQAATAAPVVIGSSRLGEFHNVIVDEGHALPAIVRSQGQASISGRRIETVIRRVRSVVPETGYAFPSWQSAGNALAEELDEELNAFLRDRPGTDVVKVGENDDPIGAIGEGLESWLKRGNRMVGDEVGKTKDMTKKIAANRASAAIAQALSDLSTVRKHWVGVARWVEPAKKSPSFDSFPRREWAAAQSAPVMVGKMLESNVWTTSTEPAQDGDDPEVHRLNVAALSATFSKSFPREAGLTAVTRAYPSPFDEAYGNSMLYVPRAVDDIDVDALKRQNWSRTAFDTKRHAAWALDKAVALVEANRGRALVLTANTATGRLFVDGLRRASRGRWKVLSQWEGQSIKQVTTAWRDDVNSVLVGTRSLMTGVDAPGETCSLVIVDRVPRAAGNPVDDARVEVLMPSFNNNKWAADVHVYAADAALLLEQAAGRLIRATSDRGLVAVLDPRILKTGPFAYKSDARAVYQDALARFPRKVAGLERATAFLADLRTR